MTLNIEMESLEFSKDLIQPNDHVRVIITSLPDDQSQAFNFNGSKINEVNHVFKVSVSETTKKIIIIFRRKSQTKKDNIIASTIIRYDQLAKSIIEKSNNETKSISIYDPFPSDSKDNQSILDTRKILGKIEAKVSFSEENTDKH